VAVEHLAAVKAQVATEAVALVARLTAFLEPQTLEVEVAVRTTGTTAAQLAVPVVLVWLS
jgi:hypothetical protein